MKICPACGKESVDDNENFMFLPCMNQDCGCHVWDGSQHGDIHYAKNMMQVGERIYVVPAGVLIAGEERRL